MTLRISNFRSIKDLQIDGLGQFNLFVGENNCGKTSVLEAAYMAVALPQVSLFAMNNGRSVGSVQNDDFTTLYHNANPRESISVGVTNDTYSRKISVLALPQYTLSHNMLLGVGDGSSHIDNYDVTVETNLLKSAYTVHFNQKNALLSNSPLSEEEFRNISNDASLRKAFFMTAQWIYNYTTVGYINNVIVHKQKKSLLENLKKIDKSIQNIEMGNNNILYVDIGLEKLIPIQFAGLGIRKFIEIASILYSLKDGILFIDEFENGLHYETMNILWSAVVALCKDLNIQLFATTHSYECIESFVNATKGGLTYRIERTETGHRAVQYTSDDVFESIRRRWELR